MAAVGGGMPFPDVLAVHPDSERSDLTRACHGSPLHVGVWLLARADHELQVEGREDAEQPPAPPALP